MPLVSGGISSNSGRGSAAVERPEQRQAGGAGGEELAAVDCVRCGSSEAHQFGYGFAGAHNANLVIGEARVRAGQFDLRHVAALRSSAFATRQVLVCCAAEWQAAHLAS